MRFHFDPTPEQRAALEAQLARLQQPVAALELLAPILPAGLAPATVVCTLQSVHTDRFVVQVRLRAQSGAERMYALKAYSDDFGERVWAHAQQLVERLPPRLHRPCLPIRYLPQERVLVFDWVEGWILSKIVDGRKPELLRHAAAVAADLHRAPLVPERPTTAQMLVDETRARCDNLRPIWPGTADLVQPLLAELQAAVPHLDTTQPAPIHGDMAAGQFLWTGERLVLLDWDMFGYADPAYDAGHFVAQLDRRCALDRTLPPEAGRWPGCFRDAYLTAMPHVSARNVSFYRALTLLRKTYTVCRRQPAEGPQQAVRLAACARAALEDVRRE
jgi:phosphotransferase family enzyme